MEASYFENIERHCKDTYWNAPASERTIIPNRRCLRGVRGHEIPKIVGVSEIPTDTIKRMVDGANAKYKRTMEQTINKIQNSKRKGTTKYQTLGYKQAKEIKAWCIENNVNCEIIEDQNVTRNKLSSVDIWFDREEDCTYDDGTRDYGRQFLDFRTKKQNVVYIQIIK